LAHFNIVTYLLTYCLSQSDQILRSEQVREVKCLWGTSHPKPEGWRPELQVWWTLCTAIPFSRERPNLAWWQSVQCAPQRKALGHRAPHFLALWPKSDRIWHGNTSSGGAYFQGTILPPGPRE